MKCLKRNTIPIYVCLYQGKNEILDEDGNYTGETAETFSNPIQIMANVTKVTGRVMAERYGLDEGYDRVVVFDNEERDKIIGFNEQAVLYIETLPELDENENPVITDGTPDNDYIIKSISQTFNSVLVLCKKVQ